MQRTACSAGQNKTKVGLKVEELYIDVAEKARQNKTKVGLKAEIE